MHQRKPHFKTNLFWHVLFFDCFVLFLRFGGLSVADLFFHACCLLTATAILASHRHIHKVQKLYWIAIILFLLVAVFQLVPLSPSGFSYAAPVKHRLISSVDALFPQMEYTTEITMNPQLHRFKLMAAVLDIWLLLIALMAPQPRKRVFRFWLALLALTLSSLMIAMTSGALPKHGLLSLYNGTFGGLINRNHFGTISAVLMIFLLHEIIVSFRIFVRVFRQRKSAYPSQFGKEVSYGFFFTFLFAAMFTAFQANQSRSSIILFVLSALLFLPATLFQSLSDSFSRAKVYISIGFTILLIAMLGFLPLGGGLDRLKSQGLNDEMRMDLAMIAWTYFQEAPLFGTGLGSVEAIMDPMIAMAPNTTYVINEVHNEYLQIAMELGLIGLAALLLFGGQAIIQLAKSFNEGQFSERIFVIACFILVFIVCLHSMVSFPLRVTSIRVFFILLITLGTKLSCSAPLIRSRMKIPIGVTTALGLASFAYFFFLHLETRHHNEEPDAKVAFALKYGNLYDADFYRINSQVRALIVKDQPVQDAISQIQELRPYVFQLLKQQPFNIKVMSHLFVLESLEHRFTHLEPSRADFETLKPKALAIRDLAKDRNYQSRRPLFFLFSLYADQLNPEETIQFSEYTKNFKHQMREIAKTLDLPK